MCISLCLFQIKNNTILSSFIHRKHLEFQTLAKVAEVLTTEGLNLPQKVVVVLLKCLMNSCVNGSLQTAYTSNSLTDIKQSDVYSLLARENIAKDISRREISYSLQTHFPYDNVVEWTRNIIIHYFIEEKTLTEEQKEVLRLSVQFLCNLVVFSCNISTLLSTKDLKQCIQDENLKKTMM